MSESYDPVMRALIREHIASPSGYRDPAGVVSARKALGDLLVRTKDRSMSRDERRLVKRYRSVVDAHRTALVEKWGTAAPI